MRPAILASLLLLVVSAVASADSIDAVAPSSIYVYDVEEFLTIRGSGLAGNVDTTVLYDGPGGRFEVEANNISPELLVTWIPVGVAIVPGHYTVTVNAIDDNGTRVIGPAFFDVIDRPVEQPPILSMPESVSAEAASSRGAFVQFTVTATSFVDPQAVVQCDHESGALYPLGQTVVGCTATDSFGTVSGSFPIFVNDTVAPILTIPGDIRTTDPNVTFLATAQDAIDGSVTPFCSPGPGTFPQGVTEVTCTAIDFHANRAVGTFLVSVVTGPPPVLTLPSDITREATSIDGAIVSYTATTSDGDISCAPASGATFSLGTTNVQCTAVSGTGGAVSGTFKINVVDTTPPHLTLPADIEITNPPNPSGAIVTFVASASDVADGNTPIACTPGSGSFFATGVTTVTCTATDSSGNVAGGSFKVTIGDAPPVLNLPTGVTAEAVSFLGAVVTFTATATDAIDGNRPVTCTPHSGSLFPLGTTTVNCSASDLHGHTSTGSFPVKVQDTTPPVVLFVTALPNVIWPPNHKMVPAVIVPVAFDTVDLFPFSHIVSVSSNQPQTGPGNHDPDWQITGPLTLNVRSERTGDVDRIYTITLVTQDNSGNATTSIATIRVGQTHGRR